MAYHGYYQHGGDGPHVLAWLVFLLLLALLVGLIAVFLGRFGGPRWAPGAGRPGPRPGEDPLELVRLRYARGEIDRETFLQTSQDLSGGAPPG